MTPALASVTARVPVTVITGFLGSGKTTLLNRLLISPALADSAVIINEFGEIGVDHLLVSAPAENMVLLDTGCLCCTVRGDLVQTLKDLHAKRESGLVPRFGHLLIETSGLADPVPLLQTVVADDELRGVYRLHDVVTLVDAVHGDAQLDSHEESVKQAAVADALLVTKTDLAEPESTRALKARLAGLNPGASLHEVVRGAVDLTAVLRGNVDDPESQGDHVERWLNSAAYVSRDHEHSPGDTHHHDARVRSFAIYRDAPVRHAGLVMWLDMLATLRGANLLRVKGVLNVEGEPVVVHAVQSVIHEPVVLDRWPSDDRRSRLVFITRNLEREEVARTLEALDYAAPRRGTTVDAEAYAQFVNAMRGFR